MFNQMLDALAALQGFAVMVFFTYLFILVLGFIIISYAKENSHIHNFTLILYSARSTNLLLLNSHILKILFLIWLVRYQVLLYQEYLVMYLVILLATLILSKDYKRIVNNVINGIATIICLYIMSLLLDYNSQIYYLWTNELIYYLFAVFVIIYNIVEVFKDIESISASRRFKLDDDEIFGEN